MHTLPFFNPIDQLNPYLRIDFCGDRVCAVLENADTQIFAVIVLCLIALLHLITVSFRGLLYGMMQSKSAMPTTASVALLFFPSLSFSVQFSL